MSVFDCTLNIYILILILITPCVIFCNQLSLVIYCVFVIRIYLPFTVNKDFQYS